jgi:hypothetical protein
VSLYDASPPSPCSFFRLDFLALSELLGFWLLVECSRRLLAAGRVFSSSFLATGRVFSSSFGCWSSVLVVFWLLVECSRRLLAAGRVFSSSFLAAGRVFSSSSGCWSSVLVGKALDGYGRDFFFLCRSGVQPTI